jgi:hypothetical protein
VRRRRRRRFLLQQRNQDREQRLLEPLVPRPEGAGAGEVFDRLAQPVLVGDRQRQVVVRVARVGSQAERLAERALGIRMPPALAAGAALLEKLVEIYAP